MAWASHPSCSATPPASKPLCRICVANFANFVSQVAPLEAEGAFDVFDISLTLSEATPFVFLRLGFRWRRSSREAWFSLIGAMEM